ncbi:MAG: hypothetical protein ABSG74_06225 [Candidatus Bathyarchaeia archaeon]|jgi:hypothetical protein
MNDDLHRIRVEIENMVYGSLQAKVQKTKSALSKVGLTCEESDAWIANEPNFNLPPKRPPDKLPMHPGGYPPLNM